MSNIHYFQRYTSQENAVTNNTLQLLARIYAYSTAKASQLLTELTGEPIEIGIEINQQKREEASVPDGAIIQRNFKVLIESKVDSGMDIDQLLRHSDSFGSEEQKILLLLTREPLGSIEADIKRQISKRHPGVLFKATTYEQICNVVVDLFMEYEYEMRDIVNDYVEYCNDADLFDQSRYLLRIVPCGVSLEINKKHGIYFQPSDRGYTRHRFVGIYKEKVVQAIWEIDSVFDIEWNGEQLNKSLVEGRDTDEYDQKLIEIIKDAQTECGYEIASGHRFFCGIPVDTDYRKSSWGGMQGPRFINLKEVLGDFSDVTQVAIGLNGKKWE